MAISVCLSVIVCCGRGSMFQHAPNSLVFTLTGAVYQIVPVGIDGYRSPEASQLIVSNDLSVFSPALTVKTDIWLVGLILLRMLNRCNGPRKHS